MAGDVTKQKGLTERQERFCIEYVLNKGNASLAARRAGYSESGDEQEGYRLLRKADIIARIEELRAQSGVKTGANIEWLESMLVSAIERCAQKEPVRDNQGIPTGEYKFDSRGLASNAAILIKLKGWESGDAEIPLDALADKVAQQWKEMKSS